MPTAQTKAPKEMLAQAKEHMDKAEWKDAVSILQPLFTSRPGDQESKTNVAKAHFLKAQCLVHMADLEKALARCTTALSLAKETMDQTLECEVLRLLGNISWKKADYKKAIEHLNKALELAKKLKDIRLEGMVHLEIGSTYTCTSENLIAEREYREAVLALERAGDVRELTRAYNNFANNFMYLKNWEKAAEMFAKCKKMAEKVNDEGLFAWGGFNRAECLVELGRPKEALQELDVALPLLEKTGDNYGIVGATQIVGMAYAKLGDWKEAEEHLIKARRLAQKNKMPVSEGLIIRDIGRMYKWRGDKDKALLYLNEAKEVFEKHGAKRELEKVNEELKGLA